jgi:Flagellar hook-length control protein FliK
MPVQNPTIIKSSHPTQLSQRKMSQPIEMDFDALLTRSIEEATGIDKDTGTNTLSSEQGQEKGMDAQVEIALPFPALPAALQSERVDGSNPPFAIIVGHLQQTEADQSKQLIPGEVVIATKLPNGLDSQQKPVPSIALVAPSSPFNAEFPLQYSKNATGSTSAISRTATTNAEAVPTPGIDVKARGSDHRLSSLAAVIADSNTAPPSTTAEPSVTLIASNTVPGNSTDFIASISSLPASIGLTDWRTDLKVAELNGNKEIASIQSTIGSGQWAEEASQTIHLLVKQNQHQAEIKVNPVELGPIEIQIAMVQGEASISFVAEHSETRNALEVALPRLKELLADSGISLTGTFVGSERQPPQQSVHTPFKDLISDSSTSAESPIVGTSILKLNANNKPGVDVYA